MAWQTDGLKKNFGATSPISSTSRNEEDTPPPLGNSEVPSVQHSVREPIPEFRQGPEEGSKRPSPIRRQDTGDIFPDNPFRPDTRSQLQIDKGEFPAWVVESSSQSG
jgi:hypothetical protein